MYILELQSKNWQRIFKLYNDEIVKEINVNVTTKSYKYLENEVPKITITTISPETQEKTIYTFDTFGLTNVTKNGEKLVKNDNEYDLFAKHPEYILLNELFTTELANKTKDQSAKQELRYRLYIKDKINKKITRAKQNIKDYKSTALFSNNHAINLLVGLEEKIISDYKAYENVNNELLSFLTNDLGITYHKNQNEDQDENQ